MRVAHNRGKVVGEPRPAPAEEPLRYVIAPEAIDAQGRSPAALALQRRCSRCWATLYQDPGALFSISFDEHRERIQECCSTQVEYMAPQMPVLEVAFRALLAAGPRGLSLGELHQALTKARGGVGLVPGPSAESLRRMLVGDRYYGIREVAPAKAASPAPASG